VPTLEQFVKDSDANIYSPHGVMTLLQRAQVRIMNPHNTVSELFTTLSHANLVDISRLRPSWDSYFMHLADLAAKRSNCMKRRVGCVLVRNGRVISTGYNGTPRGMINCNEGGCSRCNLGEGSGQSLASCLCLHAEAASISLTRADCRKMPCWKQERNGLAMGVFCIVIRTSRLCAMAYPRRCPCLTCSVKIVQVGVTEVVYNVSYSMDMQAEDVMTAGGVKVRQFSPPQEGLIG